MRVLLLTPIPHYLAPGLEDAGDTYEVSMDKPGKWPEDIDFVVSFGYRHIIKPDVIQRHRGRMINIHISLLPWNRGAEPNFWSWFDRTPKGVSIHAIDEGIDTGDIIFQLPIDFKDKSKETLRSSHATLTQVAACLFIHEWPKKIRKMDWNLIVPTEAGSYHRISDKDPWMNKLPKGWDTPVTEVEELGAASKGN